uniref:Uncharacterized protein n=1 Tax=Triticum aestivum TaxID=4565 RepID=A0A3B6I2G6_WHEAT
MAFVAAVEGAVAVLRSVLLRAQQAATRPGRASESLFSELDKMCLKKRAIGLYRKNGMLFFAASPSLDARPRCPWCCCCGLVLLLLQGQQCLQANRLLCTYDIFLCSWMCYITSSSHWLPRCPWHSCSSAGRCKAQLRCSGVDVRCRKRFLADWTAFRRNPGAH